MTAFAEFDFHSSTEAVDPTVAWTTPEVGNAVFAILNERSGGGAGNGGHTLHTVTDDSENNWVKIEGFNQRLTDENRRQSGSLWWRLTTQDDEDFAGDTITVTGGDGSSNTMRLTVVEVDPDTAYNWTVADSSSLSSEDGDGSPQVSGTVADPGGTNSFSFCCAMWRKGSDALTSVTFTEADSVDTVDQGGNDSRAHGFSYTLTGEDISGTKETSADWAGAGAESIVMIATFTDGVIGGGTTVPVGSLQMMGLGL